MRDEVKAAFEEIEALKGIKWPSLRISSSDFIALPIHEQHRQLALGYLASAKSLCVEIGEQPELLDWPRAAVVQFCFHHSIELFLKSCILRRTSKIERCWHDIPDLRRQYFALFSEPQFRFRSHWSLSLKHVEEAIGAPFKIAEIDKKPDQLHRYMSKDQESPKMTYSFAPGTWLWMIEQLESDIGRICTAIEESERR